MAQALRDLGAALLGQGKLDQAAACLQRAIVLAPDEAAAHNDLGVIRRRQGRLVEAAVCYLRATRLQPELTSAHYDLGLVLQAQGKLSAAADSYRRAIALKPDFAEAHNNLGNVLQDRLDPEAAADSYRRAIALKPGLAEAHNNLGNVLNHQGNLVEAAAAYRRAIASRPDFAEALYHLAYLRPMNDGSPESEAEFALLSRAADDLDRFAPQGRAEVLFAMARALEDRGDFDRAFACMARANAIHRAGLTFDIAEAERQMEEIAQVFDPALLRRLEGTGVASSRPVFIVGMPRSGSTLVEQIISAHPQAFGAGEIGAFANLVAATRGPDGSSYPLWVQALTGANAQALGQAYLGGLPAEAPGRRLVTDKLLSNFLWLGLIHLCLPNARVIHCRRDPRDLGMSCFAIRFGGGGQEYAYDLAEFGRYWRAYDRLMDHWRSVLPPGRILDAPYEAVVGDIETWARRLIAHCGLEWDEACLRFHESERYVRTASSAQVRRPIYTTSVGRWRAFAPHLRPLLDALGEPWADEAYPAPDATRP